MFKVSLYGYSSDVFGYLGTEDIKDIDFERLSSDDISIVVVEDKVTNLKRYIMGVNTRTEIVQNEALKGFFKAVTFHGGREKKSWTHIVSYCSAEIFWLSIEDIQTIVMNLKHDCVSGRAFWYMDEKVKEYAEEHNIASFTDISFE